MDRKKLQILVPHYREPEAVVKPLLDSIALQQHVDFDKIGVIICNDGSDQVLSEEFLQSYPFKIEYYILLHRGISATRNSCLEKATAEYVMFCDSDDMFSFMLGLYQILTETETGFDVMTSLLTMELKNRETGEIYYENREMDGIFVHGKVFRREFLMKNEIWFDERLNVCCEDSYFVSLCLSISKNTIYCPIPFYMWKYHEGSVSHRDKDYEAKAYRYIIESNDYLLEDLLSRGIRDKAVTYAASLVINVYGAIKDPNTFGPEQAEYAEETEKLIGEWCQKYRYLYEESTVDEKDRILDYVYDDFNPMDTQQALLQIERWLDLCMQKYE